MDERSRWNRTCGMDFVMSMIAEQWAFLRDVQKLISKAESLGFVLTAGEMWRPETQAWVNSLPAQSKLIAILPDSTKREFGSLVGGAGILKSKHGDRLAVDFNIFKIDNMTRLCTRDESLPLGEYWVSLSPKNRWGGAFTTRVDSPHFERNII